VCNKIGYDACFLAGLKKLDLDGEPFRPRKIIHASYYREAEFSFLVDITEEFETKVKAVAAYHSQFGSTEAPNEGMFNLRKDIFSPGVTIHDLMVTRARNLGQLAGVGLAEAYTVKERILVDDPLNMPVNSI